MSGQHFAHVPHATHPPITTSAARAAYLPGDPLPGTDKEAAAVGIDIGGTKILGILMDINGEVIADDTVPTPVGENVIEAIVGMVLDMDASSMPLGIGIPGLVTREGVLTCAPNMTSVDGLSIGTEVAQRLADRTSEGTKPSRGLRHRASAPQTPISVAVDNDATCAMWAEWAVGAARGASNAIMVTLGTGIGGGMILNGQLMRGENGFAGEVGHFQVDPNGPTCSCGRQGCWESLASGTGLAFLAQEAIDNGRGGSLAAAAAASQWGIMGEDVTMACLDGEPAALEIMDMYCRWVAVGLSGLVEILDPEMVVIGGGIGATGDTLMVPVRRHFGEMMEPRGDTRPKVQLVSSELGIYSGAVGAGLLALDAI